MCNTLLFPVIEAGIYTSEDLDLFLKLWRKRCFSSGKTIQIDNLVKGFPSHITGVMRGRVDILIKQGVLIKIPHKYGDKVYINRKYRKQIEIELKKQFPFL